MSAEPISPILAEPHPGTDAATTRSSTRGEHRGWPLRWADGGLLVGLYVLLTAVGVTVGLLITHPFKDSGLTRVDRSIAEWFANNRTGTLNTLTTVGSQLSDTMTKIPVTALVCVAMAIVWRRWREPLLVALTLIVEAAAFITITLIVSRPRPDVPRLESSPVDSSFPSGHTAAAVVYAAIVVVIFWHTRSRWIRALSVAVVTLITLAVGLSRMYRGMHFLSDVVFGALLGGVTVIAVTAILQRADRRSARSARGPVVAGDPPTAQEPARRQV